MRYVLGFFVVLLRKFSPVSPPAKSQISRSAPLLLTPSKILTNIFRTANNLSDCKTTIHVRAGCASMALAIFLNDCDRYSKFEQDSRCSGRRVRADPRALVASGAGLFLAPG
ncbi:hypothetical protein [Citrobacter sp. S39]|uniref:hypothetical protein n=1 Tax=Citrobacter sp. S39 TaxID=2660638 RepID=UPI0025B39C9F|nr:hypothetical protein [Citrobacter sp. S39]